MRLQISTVIDNKHVRLDFRKSPDRPENMPSYKIENAKADEFVLKYNELSEKLTKRSNTVIVFSAIAGALASGKILMGQHTHKYLKAIGALIGTTGIATGITAAISSKIKNNLMDKYNVKEIKENN
jgi:hypothetical protein